MSNQIRPKLVVRGADEAIDYYRRTLGATLRERYTMGDQVVFALLEVHGTLVELKDSDGVDPGPAQIGGTPVILSLVCDDPDAVAGAMVEAGATVVFPVADQPYGARQGRVRDPFGHVWILGTPITMDPGEIQASLDR